MTPTPIKYYRSLYNRRLTPFQIHQRYIIPRSDVIIHCMRSCSIIIDIKFKPKTINCDSHVNIYNMYF